jgi:hypothetical protein
MAVTAFPSSEAAAMSPGLPAMSGPVGPALLSFAKCFGARDSHEVYMSAPITTGEAYVAWRHNHGAPITRDHPQYESLHYENVISANVTRVGPLVAKLRRRYPDRLVIDPTSLDNIDGWSQSDYHDFWRALIEKYVALVVFADGWQFSTGCVYEFATALRSGKEVYAESLKPLDRQDGLHMIAAAVAEFENLNVDAESLRRALQSVERATESG